MTAPVRRDGRGHSRPRSSLADAAVSRSYRGPLRGTTSHGQSPHVAVDRRCLPHPSPTRPPAPTPATTPARLRGPALHCSRSDPPQRTHLFSGQRARSQRPIHRPVTQAGHPAYLIDRQPCPSRSRLQRLCFRRRTFKLQQDPGSDLVSKDRRQKPDQPDVRGGELGRTQLRGNHHCRLVDSAPNSTERPALSRAGLQLAVADYAWCRPSIPLTPEIANSPKSAPRHHRGPSHVRPCGTDRRSHHPYVASHAEQGTPDLSWSPHLGESLLLRARCGRRSGAQRR
jgi:hypothetical protein